LFVTVFHELDPHLEAVPISDCAGSSETVRRKISEPPLDPALRSIDHFRIISIDLDQNCPGKVAALMMSLGYGSER